MDRAISLAGQSLMKMWDDTCSFLPNMILGIIVCCIFFSISGQFRKIIVRLGEHARLDITLVHALGTLTATAVNILGLLFTAVLIVPGFKLTHIITGLGVTSIAVGFAFKDILENFFAGLLLLWQKPFRLGDVIKTGEFEGMVEEMRIKSTYLRTEDGELVIIPNGSIFIKRGR